MVFGSCSSPSKYSLKDYLTISMVVFSLAKYVFFTCEDIMFPREGSPQVFYLSWVIPYMGNIGTCGPKVYGFSSVIVIFGVSILAISVDNRAWVFVV